MGQLADERAQAEAAKAADGSAFDALAFLRLQREGGLEFDLGKRIAEVIAGVQAERRAGKLTLVLTFTPAAKNDASKVVVRDSIKADPPLPENSPSLFYTTDEHTLQRDNPLQRSFRDIAPKAGFPEAER